MESSRSLFSEKKRKFSEREESFDPTSLEMNFYLHSYCTTTGEREKEQNSCIQNHEKFFFQNINHFRA